VTPPAVPLPPSAETSSNGHHAPPVPSPSVPPSPPSDDAPVHTERAEPVVEPAHAAPPRTVTFEDGDDLDVPDFLK
ncbi:MAG: cell division protein FtsZ, partial [Phycicoccus sp.]